LELNDINAPSSIKEVIQGLIPDGDGVIEGRVISESPLQIQAINDDKLILSENLLCLPRHLSKYKTTIDIELGGGILDSKTDAQACGPHIHKLNTYNIYSATMTVYNQLKVGEIVYMLSFNQEKKYYILDREAE